MRVRIATSLGGRRGGGGKEKIVVLSRFKIRGTLLWRNEKGALIRRGKDIIK